MAENNWNDLSPATIHWFQEIHEKFNCILGRYLRPALKDYVLYYYPNYVRMNGSDDPYKMIHFLSDANKGTTIHSVLTQSNYGRNNISHFNDLIFLDDWSFTLNNWIQLCRWIGDLEAEEAVESGKIELYQHLVERLERANRQRNNGIMNDQEYLEILQHFNNAALSMRKPISTFPRAAALPQQNSAPLSYVLRLELMCSSCVEPLSPAVEIVASAVKQRALSSSFC